VCRRHESGQLEILDPFWPYERVSIAADAEQAYITAIATLLRRYRCVQCAFTPLPRGSLLSGAEKDSRWSVLAGPFCSALFGNM